MLILLFLFALFRQLQGAPLAAHNDTFPTVHNLPRRSDVVFGTRTTSDIVTSCLATIFACTWTAIHPNIPSPVGLALEHLQTTPGHDDIRLISSGIYHPLGVQAVYRRE